MHPTTRPMSMTGLPVTSLLTKCLVYLCSFIWSNQIMKILPCTVFETGLNPFYFSDATCDEKCAFLYKNENVITGKENE